MQPIAEEIPLHLYQPPMQHFDPSQGYENFEFDGNFGDGIVDESEAYLSETPTLISDTDVSADGNDGLDAQHACITSHPKRMSQGYGVQEQACGA
jgi:hypothetical protein